MHCGSCGRTVGDADPPARSGSAAAAQVRGRSLDGAGGHRVDHQIVRAVLAGRLARCLSAAFSVGVDSPGDARAPPRTDRALARTRCAAAAVCLARRRVRGRARRSRVRSVGPAVMRLESGAAHAPPAGFAASDDGFVASQLGDGGEDGAPVAVEERDDGPPRGTGTWGSECRSVVRASWPKACRQAAVGVASPRAARLLVPAARAVSARRLRWAGNSTLRWQSRRRRRRGEAPRVVGRRRGHDEVKSDPGGRRGRPAVDVMRYGAPGGDIDVRRVDLDDGQVVGGRPRLRAGGFRGSTAARQVAGRLAVSRGALGNVTSAGRGRRRRRGAGRPAGRRGERLCQPCGVRAPR